MSAEDVSRESSVAPGHNMTEEAQEETGKESRVGQNTKMKEERVRFVFLGIWKKLFEIASQQTQRKVGKWTGPMRNFDQLKKV